MRISRRHFIGSGILFGMAGCTPVPSRFIEYDGPEVTRLSVFKDARILQLHHHDQVVYAFPMQMGFAPTGHKQVSGDGRTPQGAYTIDRRNPNSAYHLSIGISYPNEADVAAALAIGKSPGGNIFIHGTPRMFQQGGDWTAGCIAVQDSEMELIYAAVKDGTPIMIYP